MDKCCNECWHSPEKPCDMFVRCCNEGPLCHKNDECHHKYLELNKKLRYESHDVPIIFIGMGTCRLASGPSKVEEAIRAELPKLNIKAQIEPTGCIGYCSKEVIVDIKHPGEERISYCEITPKIVSKFIQKTLVDKQIFTEKLLGTHNKANTEILSIHNNPFFKNHFWASAIIFRPIPFDLYLLVTIKS
jgi:NADH-quinone oxidoreductase subunit F